LLIEQKFHKGYFMEFLKNEDLSVVFNDETTPIKACVDFADNDNNSGKTKTLLSGMQFHFVYDNHHMQL